MSFLDDVVNVLTFGTLTPAEDAVMTGTKIVSDLTDGVFWRSFGWLLLGIATLGIGISILLRETVERGVGQVAKAVAL